MTLLLEGAQALAPVEAFDVGDQFIAGGEWLTIARIQLGRRGDRYLTTTCGRVFHALPEAQRIARPAQEQAA